MNKLLELLHITASWIVDAVRWPVSGFSPLVQLIILSALSGVILLVIYGRVSNQRAIRRVKNKIYAALLEVILFRNNLRVCLSAQGRMFAYGFVYFCYALPPLLVLLFPCVLLLAQLNLYFNYRPLQVGERAILRVKVEDPSLLDKLTLASSPGLKITPALRVPAKNEVYWRLEAAVAGEQQATIDLKTDGNDPAAATMRRSVQIGVQAGPIFSGVFKNWWQALLYPDPARGTLSSLGRISEISLSYPAAKYAVAGYTIHWIALFFIVSLISGLAASKFLGVEI